MNKLRGIVYSLKQKYGKAIDLYKHTSVPDYETGIQTITRTKVHINKAIVLPSLNVLGGRLLSYQNIGQEDIRRIGGYTSLETKIIIIDYKDLPKNYKILVDDYIIINFERYDINKVHDLDFGGGFMLETTEVPDAELSQIAEIRVHDRLTFISNSYDGVHDIHQALTFAGIASGTL